MWLHFRQRVMSLCLWFVTFWFDIDLDAYACEGVVVRDSFGCRNGRFYLAL